MDPFQSPKVPSSCMQEDAEEVAARQRLGKLSTRSTSASTSRPPAASSLAGTAAGLNRQSAASTSGRHIAPPKLTQDDSWAAELDNDDSWDSLEQKSATGELLSSCMLISLHVIHHWLCCS